MKHHCPFHQCFCLYFLLFLLLLFWLHSLISWYVQLILIDCKAFYVKMLAMSFEAWSECVYIYMCVYVHICHIYLHVYRFYILLYLSPDYLLVLHEKVGQVYIICYFQKKNFTLVMFFTRILNLRDNLLSLGKKHNILLPEYSGLHPQSEYVEKM